MKFFILNIIIVLTMIISSCNPSEKNPINQPLRFSWRIAGEIPPSPDGKPSPGLAGPVTGFSNNVFIVGGGANFPDGMPWNGGKKVYHNDIYIFKSEKDSLINNPQNVQLPFNLAYSANCSTNKGIIAAGGENEQGPLDKVLLILWDSTSQKVIISDLPDLPQPLTDGAIAAYNNKVYFAGGIGADSVSKEFYVLDLKDTAKEWQILPSLPHPVSHAVLYVQSNGKEDCIYLVGGRKEIKDSTSVLYNQVYQFNLGSKEWSQKAFLPYALSAQTGVSWGDSTLLVFSGDQGKTFHATELLLMKIAKEKDPVKKEQLIDEKNKLQESHPGYSGTVLAYNTHNNTWMAIDSIPFPGQVTTTAVKWDNEIFIPCGEIKAGVRTPHIIVGKVSE